MRLLRFELYKIFSQKMIYVTFIILFCLSSSYILNIDKTDDQVKEFYKEWEGTLTSEKIKMAQTSHDQLMVKTEERLKEMTDNGTEGNIFSETDSIKADIYENIAFIQEVQKNLDERLEGLKSSSQYNAELERELIQDVDLSYFSFYRGPAEIIDYTSTLAFVITGAMLLIGLSTIYTKEYSSGVDNYILSSKKGRTVLTWAKLGAASIYVIAVVAAWEAVNVISKLYILGNLGWNTPLQFVFKYYSSPYGLTMLEYHLIQIGIHLAAAFGFAILILFISSVSRNSLLSFFLSGAIFSLPFMIVEMMALKPWAVDAVKFSYLYIMRVEFLFEYFKTINFFGYPVLYPIAAVLWMIVLSAVIAMVTFRVMKNKEVSI
ncbi:hypothetical protein FZC84_01090 [Rossellomorea vietnamensis]|uniref:Uncharacterized protein n=1 Tax=Rossellomorea vietnamensis TaxID=218284 RepID=A0A5D4MHQ8_9BACI|nr:hypothetical protein [Rossellomorea vietnamensis]TYS01283.1 hypothetical protein FZC84_01090 [Rossellomorea vietnamensis]